jgi:hypothetical protein
VSPLAEMEPTCAISSLVETSSSAFDRHRPGVPLDRHRVDDAASDLRR